MRPSVDERISRAKNMLKSGIKNRVRSLATTSHFMIVVRTTEVWLWHASLVLNVRMDGICVLYL